MRCDNCKFSQGESASMDYPYPITYCAKGHWDGHNPDEPEPEIDPWKDCSDFFLLLWEGPQTQQETP